MPTHREGKERCRLHAALTSLHSPGTVAKLATAPGEPLASSRVARTPPAPATVGAAVAASPLNHHTARLGASGVLRLPRQLRWPRHGGRARPSVSHSSSPTQDVVLGRLP